MKEDMSELKKRALAIVDIYSDLNRMTEREADILRKAITTDRTQGEWKETGYETGALGITYRQTQCSNCGWEHALPMWWNFCPNCGAKMQKGGAE